MTGTAILTHGDLDGITSGAISLLAHPSSDVYFSRPSQIANDLRRVARDSPSVVVISDIAVNVTLFPEILRALERFPDSTVVHWIDHHPILDRQREGLAKRVDLFHEVGPCAAELVYRKFEPQLPEHAVRLALYGAIGDYCDGTPFAVSRLEDYDKRTLYLEAGLLVQALQEIDYRHESRELLRALSLGIQPSSMGDIVALAMKATRIEHEIFRYVRQAAKKHGPVGYVIDMPLGGYRGKSAKFAAYVTDSKVGISARSSDGEVDMSIRRRRAEVDLNRALQEVLADFDGAHGGGHPAAAGASMSRADFLEFVRRLAEYVESIRPGSTGAV